MAHPVLPFAYHMNDAGGDTYHNLSNTQLTGTTNGARLASFLAQCSKWRVAYAGVTITADGPALADQGTISVCQQDVSYQLFNPGNVPDGDPSTPLIMHVLQFDQSGRPLFANNENMPSAFMGPSKAGAYVPLKLTKTSQQWHSPIELAYQTSNSNFLGTGGNTVPPFFDSYTAAQANAAINTAAIWPFYDITPFGYTLTGTIFTGSPVLPPCNETVASISVQNVSYQTSFTLYFRLGFEVQVVPGTAYTMEQRCSPEYDPLAISSYFGVSRSLKDAYPSDYNLRGKLWGTIADVLENAGPALSTIPVYGAPLSAAAKGLLSFGDFMSHRSEQIKPKQQNSNQQNGGRRKRRKPRNKKQQNNAPQTVVVTMPASSSGKPKLFVQRPGTK